MTDTSSAPRHYRAPSALLPEGWRPNVRITVGGDGFITGVETGHPEHADGSPPEVVSELRGPVVPGMPNLHSHAFQRAMAGLAEVGDASAPDSFWGWRNLMYGFVGKLTPEDLEAIATQLFVEMLEAGYTSVGEGCSSKSCVKSRREVGRSSI